MNLKNNVTLIGRLTKSVNTSQTANGIMYSNFSIAVDRPYRKDKEREVDFINCTAWGKTAEFISKHFEQGAPIMIAGELRQHNYTNKDGIKVFTYVVNVDTVEFALTVKSKAAQNDNNVSVAAGDIDLSEFEDMYAGEGDNPF